MLLHLFGSILIFNVIAYYIPKTLTRQEMCATSLLAGMLQINVDVYLDLKYDYYGYFSHGPDFASLIPILGIYPALNIIFLNYYPFTMSWMSKAKYITGWVVFSLIYEWSSVKAGWFYYDEWKLWYSALCYPPIYYILVKNLDIFRRL
ncbi:hypothetical protein [Pelosinus propionicus]|uniref:Uncharacterized protein n=1 Tax=Pelosinus propionicus DSM 13327 TaxID=1123291 RepID=A0A1I4PBA2_9FIRM|nr:hypothetical protein [Pelosinus propionicus]SFM24653.1 hypothetical protein SAMN04490355_106019 [Pelosinus propionicus DSM 13327]